MEHRLSEISFPGLGVGEFQIDGVALSFELFGRHITIMWYGIIICLGIILGFSYFAFRAREKGLSLDDIIDITLVTVLIAIAGARLYYVVFKFTDSFLVTSGSFLDNVKDTLYNIIAVWQGGLAIYGGVIGGFFALLFMSKRKKRPVFRLTDMVVPGLMIGQLIGRWGNFMNGEAFGAETALPWRMGIRNALTHGQTLYVHPTFFYESLWNLIGFFLINAFYKKKKYDGEVTLWYFGWYGLGRGFIELLRTDSLYIGPIRVSSMLSFLFAAAVIPTLILLRRKYAAMVAAGGLEQGEVTSFAVLFGMKEANNGRATVDTEAVSSTEASDTEAVEAENAEAGDAEAETAEAEATDGESSLDGTGEEMTDGEDH